MKNNISIKRLFSSIVLGILSGILLRNIIHPYININFLIKLCFYILLLRLSVVCMFYMYFYGYNTLSHCLDRIENYFYRNVPIKIKATLLIISLVFTFIFEWIIWGVSKKLDLNHLVKNYKFIITFIVSNSFFYSVLNSSVKYLFSISEIKCTYFYSENMNEIEDNIRYIIMTNFGKHSVYYKIIGICTYEEIRKMQRTNLFKSSLHQPTFSPSSENFVKLEGKETSKSYKMTFEQDIPKEFYIIYLVAPSKIKYTYVKEPEKDIIVSENDKKG